MVGVVFVVTPQLTSKREFQVQSRTLFFILNCQLGSYSFSLFLLISTIPPPPAFIHLLTVSNMASGNRSNNDHSKPFKQRKSLGKK